MKPTIRLDVDEVEQAWSECRALARAIHAHACEECRAFPERVCGAGEALIAMHVETVSRVRKALLV